MESKEYKLWIVRDNNGKLYLYNEKPKYYNDLKVWFSGRICAKLDNNIFSDLTFEDIKYLLVWRFHWSNNFCNFKE